MEHHIASNSAPDLAACAPIVSREVAIAEVDSSKLAVEAILAGRELAFLTTDKFMPNACDPQLDKSVVFDDKVILSRLENSSRFHGLDAHDALLEEKLVALGVESASERTMIIRRSRAFNEQIVNGLDLANVWAIETITITFSGRNNRARLWHVDKIGDPRGSRVTFLCTLVSDELQGDEGGTNKMLSRGEVREVEFVLSGQIDRAKILSFYEAESTAQDTLPALNRFIEEELVASSATIRRIPIGKISAIATGIEGGLLHRGVTRADEPEKLRRVVGIVDVIFKRPRHQPPTIESDYKSMFGGSL